MIRIKLLIPALLLLVTIGCQSEVNTEASRMQLWATPDLVGVDYELISADASVSSVAQKFDSMSWQRLSALKLKMSSRLFIEASGSYEDGFALIYGEGHDQYITKDGPTFELMRDCVLKFASLDESWKSTVEWTYFQKWDY